MTASQYLGCFIKLFKRFQKCRGDVFWVILSYVLFWVSVGLSNGLWTLKILGSVDFKPLTLEFAKCWDTLEKSCSICFKIFKSVSEYFGTLFITLFIKGSIINIWFCKSFKVTNSCWGILSFHNKWFKSLLTLNLKHPSMVIRQKGESQNGCFKKAKHAKISEKNICLFFGNFDVLCFLETPVLRFALLPYYRRLTRHNL